MYAGRRGGVGLVEVSLGACNQVRPLPRILLSATWAFWEEKILRDKHVQCREEMERFIF